MAPATIDHLVGKDVLGLFGEVGLDRGGWSLWVGPLEVISIYMVSSMKGNMKDRVY